MKMMCREEQDETAAVSDPLDARVDEILDDLVALDREAAALDARRVRLYAEAARIADVKAGGYFGDVEHERSLIATEIGLATRRGSRTVTAMIGEAEALVDTLPATMAALLEGRVSYGHARQMVCQAITLPVDARAGFERALLPVAEQQTPYRFGIKARQLRELAHPESIIVRNRAARERRGVGIGPDYDGMALLTALLPAEDAVAIDDRLDRLADAHLADRDSAGAGDVRTKEQLRVDFLTDLILHPDTLTDAENRVAAQILITVPATTIAGASDDPGHLHGHGPIDAETARRIAATAPTFLQILQNPTTRVPVEVYRCWGTPSKDGTRARTWTGRERYTASPTLRQVLAVEDETCRFPHCGRRANRCELDHTQDWARGGTTTPENLHYLCTKHHHFKHDTRWDVETHPDKPRHLNWRSPYGRTYTTTPARDGTG